MLLSSGSANAGYSSFTLHGGLLPLSLVELRPTSRLCSQMTVGQSFAVARGTHARNMYTIISPYCYGLAVRAPRIYNGVACSGGQGVRPSRRMLPLEATRPGQQGTPGLVNNTSPAAESLSLRELLHRHNRIWKTHDAVRGHRARMPALKAIREIAG